MNAKRQSLDRSKPRFAWQAALIVLPVVLLTIVGLLFLHQDRLLVEREAAQQAQVVANLLAPLAWENLLREGSNTVAFDIAADGSLQNPKPYDIAPEPAPLELDRLSDEQARLWTAALDDSDSTSVNAEVAEALRRFIDSRPPRRFAALAAFRQATLLKHGGSAEEASREYQRVTAEFADVTGETGTPLWPIAQWQLVQLAADSEDMDLHSARLEALCSNLVHHPTSLSGYLLPALAEKYREGKPAEVVSHFMKLWNEHLEARRIHAAAAAELHGSPGVTPLASVSKTTLSLGLPSPASVVWFAVTPEPIEVTNVTAPTTVRFAPEWWLGLRLPHESGGERVVCRRESDAGLVLRNLIQHSPVTPAYLGVGLELAGRHITNAAPDLHLWNGVRYMTRSGGQIKEEPSELLATNQLAFTVAGQGLLKLTVYLTNPSLLQERQRARTFWFGCMIAASAVAAMIGLVSAYRTFVRQVRLNEMKSNFVSSVSHELRAPIASIRLMAESLDRGKVAEPPRQREYFAFIVRECRRLSALIENVLDFARIDQGRKNYEFEPTSVRALLEETLRLMTPQAEEKQVRLDLEVPASPGGQTEELVLDGKAMQQALINLLDNAIKHSPPGQGVTLGFERDSMSARFWVQDHGPGIPAEEHERIFERFYRCGSELRRQTQGVGIGLSIVKHVVEAHAGRVRVQSQPGQGSRFTIELPHASDCGPSGSTSFQPVNSPSAQFQAQQRVSERRPAQ